MRSRLLSLSLGWLVLAMVPAAAETLRFPGAGLPAVTVPKPDDWAARQDNANNLLLAAPNHKVFVALTMLASPGTPDEMAAKTFQLVHAAPAKAGERAKLGGLNAYVYRSSLINAKGVKLNIRLVIARIDAHHTIACDLMSTVADGDALLAPANKLVAGIKAVSK
jgi:hypothetical protein